MYFSYVTVGLDPRDYLPVTQHAEAVGFDMVWIPDHLGISPDVMESKYPYRQDDWYGKRRSTSKTHWYDAWVLAGYIAAGTKRLRIGTGVYILPLRNPFTVAQSVQSVYNLSQGRVILGVGSGWMKEEFQASGLDFATRGGRMDEMLDIMDKIWSGQRFEYHGKHFDIPLLSVAQREVPHIPIVFGGSTNVALRRTALQGDGWTGDRAFGYEDSINIRTTLEQMRVEAGTANRSFTYYVLLEPPVTADQLHRYEDAGFDNLIAHVQAGVNLGFTMQERFDDLDRFVDVVLSSGFKMDQLGANR